MTAPRWALVESGRLVVLYRKDGRALVESFFRTRHDCGLREWAWSGAGTVPEGLGAYPQLAHVIPEAYRPVTEVWAINSRYLADATMLAREAGWRTLVWSGDDGKQPLVFQPTRERPRWMAVVMPMTFGGNREGEKR